MKKTLPLPGTPIAVTGVIPKRLKSGWVPRLASWLFFLVLFGGECQYSSAQIYYTTNDGTGTSTSSNDAIKKVNYDGSGAAVLASSFTNSPSLIAMDFPNNRAFVYEAYSASVPTNLAIKVVNLSNGTVTTSIPLPARISGLRYDAASDYIYYLSTDGNGSVLSATDAIMKVKSDGSNSTVVVASVTKAPILFALDLPNNRAFVYEGYVTDRQIKVINLTNGTLMQSIALGAQANGVEYDPASDWIYYMTSDGNPNTATANDALIRVHPDGSSSTIITSSFTTSPFQITLDPGNNRAFVYEALVASRAIKSVNLTTGAVAAVISLSGLPSSTIVYGLTAPQPALVSTATASSITTSSATVGGNVTQSDVTVTDRGIVYSSTNSTPTTSDSKFAIGSGTGTFSGSLGSLSSSTTYYTRAYATSSAGTAYGSVSSFATAASPTTVSSINRVTSSPSNSGTVQYAVTFGASVTGLTTSNFSLTTSGVSGTSISSLSGSGASYTVTVNTGSGDGTIGLNLANATGLTPGVSTSLPYAGQSYTIDKTAPGISISSPSVVGTTAGPVSYTVTYTDANFNTSTLGTSNITLNKTGTANGTVALTGSGTSYTVTISGISGVGTLGISIAANTATDQAGNNAPSAGPSSTFSVGSSDATLSNLVLSRIKNGHSATAIFSPPFNSGTNNYTLDAPNSTATVNVTPTTNYAAATVTVNGATVASGSTSSDIGLSVGSNTITVIVTAQDATTNTYTLSIDRRNSAGQLDAVYQPLSVNRSGDQALQADGIAVHPALSPNGDGINDVFTIDGITAYPDNKVTITNRDGAVIYQAHGYDNSSKVFDGHSSINGQMQVSGTYFYTVEYQDGGDTKRKSGFVILKY